MNVKNHILYFDDGEAVPFIESPNKSGRVNPLYLIIHYTAGVSVDNAVEWLTNKNSNASAHFVIGRNGELVQMVPLNRKSWHAGESNWGELQSMNNYSIGIELVNAGRLQQRADGRWINWSNNLIPEDEVAILTHKSELKETGWQIYTEIQIQTAIEVALALNNKYNFVDVLGHDDIAPTRKIDPGPAFPMISFASIVIGRNNER